MLDSIKNVQAILLENGLDIRDLTTNYVSMAPVAKISENLKLKKSLVGKLLDELNLRRPKKYRLADYNALIEYVSHEATGIAEAMLDYQESPESDQMLEYDDSLDYIEDEVAAAEECDPDVAELNRQLNVKVNALNRQRLELNRLRQADRDRAAEDGLNDRILNRLDEHLKTEDSGYYNVYISTEDRPETLPEEGLIAVIGDMHLGAIVTDTEVAGNKFDYQVAYDRVGKYLDKVIMYPRQSKRIHVVNLYDNLQGIIHGSLERTEDSFITSIMRLVDLTVHVYSLLSEVYDEVIVHSTGSNHERTTQHIVHEGKQNDYGRLVDEMVSRCLTAAGKDNIAISVTEHGYQFFDVNGADIVAFHGDTLRSYKYSSESMRSKLQDICLTNFNKPYRHAISGHTHMPGLACNQYNGVNIVNGSLVGATPYGVQSGYRDVTPVQTIAFIGPDGELEDSSFVNLRVS